MMILRVRSLLIATAFVIALIASLQTTVVYADVSSGPEPPTETPEEPTDTPKPPTETPEPPPDGWDKSSLSFTAGCEGDCEQVRATVCNGADSRDMQGPSSWELYWSASGNPKNGSVIASGTINPLAAGACQTLTYNPADNPNGASGNYMFKAYQRPGHPGKGELWSESCSVICVPDDPKPIIPKWLQRMGPYTPTRWFFRGPFLQVPRSIISDLTTFLQVAMSK